MSRPPLILALALIASFGLALAFRLPALDRRPMHSDEAVHAYKCNELWTTGVYRYDPDEYHGPTLYYATLPVLAVGGGRDWRDTSAATYRLVPVLFGAGLVLLLWLLRDALGPVATGVAAVLTASSPVLVFYSRDYIQEMLLVFFTLLLIAAVWRYICSGRVAWAALAGVAAGLMHATKETSVIVLAALAIALAGTAGLERRAAPSSAIQLKRHFRALVIALAAGVFVSAACFSTGFTHPAGVLDALRSLATYAHRATGGDHLHPWYYYVRLVAWTYYPPAPPFSEGLILGLALVGGAAAVIGRSIDGPQRGCVRFLMLYTLALAVIYSAIPYKTPWCATGFLHGAILLAGSGVAVLWQALRPRALRGVVAAVVLLAALQLGQQAYRANFRLDSDPRNPYVYAAPVTDVARLSGYVSELVAAARTPDDVVVKVIVDNPWPLPWYLRGCAHVGYWTQLPADPDADVVVVSAALADAVESRLKATYANVCYYGLRREETLAVYVRAELRAAFVARHAQ